MPEHQQDLLKRNLFIENNLKTIERLLETGGSMAFTAPFGGGKSWLCHHLSHLIEEKSILKDNFPDIKAIQLDVSRHDLYNDALIPILGALSQSISDKGKLKKIIKKGMKLIPTVADTMLVKTLGISLSPIIEKVINNDSDREKNIKSLRDELSEYAKEKPLLFFIDELDRCREEFILNFLNRISYFFGIPKVAFVFFLNEKQLYKYIKIARGDEEGGKYLEKYISLMISIPEISNHCLPDNSFNESGIVSLYKGHLEKDSYDEFFLGICIFLADIFFKEDRNIRNIEKAIRLAKHFYKSKEISKPLDHLDAYFIHLKIYQPKTLSFLIHSEDIKSFLNDHNKLLGKASERSSKAYSFLEEFGLLHGYLSGDMASSDRDIQIRLQGTRSFLSKKFGSPEISRGNNLIQKLKSFYNSL